MCWQITPYLRPVTLLRQALWFPSVVLHLLPLASPAIGRVKICESSSCLSITTGLLACGQSVDPERGSRRPLLTNHCKDVLKTS